MHFCNRARGLIAMKMRYSGAPTYERLEKDAATALGMSPDYHHPRLYLGREQSKNLRELEPDDNMFSLFSSYIIDKNPNYEAQRDDVIHVFIKEGYDDPYTITKVIYAYMIVVCFSFCTPASVFVGSLFLVLYVITYKPRWWIKKAVAVFKPWRGAINERPSSFQDKETLYETAPEGRNVFGPATIKDLPWMRNPTRMPRMPMNLREDAVKSSGRIDYKTWRAMRSIRGAHPSAYHSLINALWKEFCASEDTHV